MTYHAGISPGAAALFGVRPGGPRIECDGCGIVLALRDDRPPPVWFRDGNAPPKWRMTRGSDGRRIDKCPRCKP